MNIILTFIYAWFTLLFLWYGRYARAGFLEKPLILTSSIFTFFFNILSFSWIALTIFLLLNTWRLPVFTFLGIFLLNLFFKKALGSLEDIALTPIAYLYRSLENWAEKKNK